MSTPALRREEGIGLAAAVVLHAGLFAVLLLHPGAKPPPIPERMTVTISDVVAEQDTSPTPNAEAAAAAAAPEIGEPAPPPAPVVSPPRPEPAKLAPPPPPAPKPVPQPKIAPKPEPKPVARPLPKVEPRPAPPKPAPIAKPRPDPIAEALAAARKAPVKASAPATRTPPAKVEGAGKSATAEKPAKKPGGSRIGNDFLAGVGAAATGKSPTPPAAAIGPDVKAGLASSIARQLKPRWVAPQGADAEQLVTVLAFDLNEDGTLNGTPRVVRQEGITDSNRAQAPRHAEQAIRAVRLAAPFDLPPQYYAAWKRVAAFRFDRKLSQ